MPNMTLSMPGELYKKVKKYSEIKWSEVARIAMQSKIDDLELLEKVKKSKKRGD